MEANINYIIGILGLILAIVGIYLTIKSNKKKEPVYSIKSNNLISGSISTLENLKIGYKKERNIASLTVSKILFYNRGAETITKQDIETRNHLGVTAKDNIKILDVSVLQSNNSSSNFEVILDGAQNQAQINFEYLNENHGGVIQVIHTGLASNDLKLYGDIMGIQKLVEFSPDQLRTQRAGGEAIKSLLIEIIATSGVALIVLLIVVAIVKLITGNTIIHIGFDNLFNGMNTLVLFAIGGVTLGMGSSLANAMINTGTILARTVLPKGLEKFLE